METKHTPGPWEAIGNLVRSPLYQPDGLPKGMQIAECKDGYSQPFTEEAKANARLIAAAPELLEAAKEFEKFTKLRELELGTLSPEMQLVVEMTRAAIAKATS